MFLYAPLLKAFIITERVFRFSIISFFVTSKNPLPVHAIQEEGRKGLV
jgi:hypothetical protein